MLLKINGTPIQQVKDTKFLLLYIDDELTWKYHVNQFTSKTLKMTGIIARARYYLPRQSVVTIYNTTRSNRSLEECVRYVRLGLQVAVEGKGWLRYR